MNNFHLNKLYYKLRNEFFLLMSMLMHSSGKVKILCEMMAFDVFRHSSHECSVNCHTISVRNAFLKNKFAKYHHFLSLSILFLSIEDETIPPPFVGYILSKYLRDSFKKFCNSYMHIDITDVRIHRKNKNE